MITKNIDLRDAIAFANRQEDHFFDRKSARLNPAKTEAAACSFANADGGEIILGIEDTKTNPDPAQRWQGRDDIESFNDHLAVLYRLTPSLPISYEFLTCAPLPGYVLHISIEKSSSVHPTSGSEVFVRQGAQTIKLKEPSKISELAFAKGDKSYEDSALREVPAEIIAESTELREFLMGYSPATDPLSFVTNQNLVDAKSWDPRVAGILLFANQPAAYVPKQCGVKIVRYETREDEPERVHLKDNFTMEGPLYPLIHDTVERVKEIMSNTSIWTTEGLKPMDYPPETIWEVIVNAVIHRDYSVSDNIQILVFDDRIEVKSPGRLPGNVTVENILESRFSRNPKIVRTLARYPDPPNKDMGEGLNTAFQRMKDWRLRDPTIREESGYVIVEIPHTPLAAPEELVLEFLASHVEISNRQARELTGIRSENTMKNVFYRLRDDGKIEPIEGRKGPASAWRLKKSRRRLAV